MWMSVIFEGALLYNDEDATLHYISDFLVACKRFYLPNMSSLSNQQIQEYQVKCLQSKYRSLLMRGGIPHKSQSDLKKIKFDDDVKIGY